MSARMKNIACYRVNYDVVGWKKATQDWTVANVAPGAILAIEWLCNEVETMDAELAALREDAERYQWLLNWLAERHLLEALFCKPPSSAPSGNYWVLRTPAMVNGDSCEGYGKTEDEAIDAARKP